MNNLGDTSFNKRNLLKQGLGVNLYPLPFAKGGSLPKPQDGKKLSRLERREARHDHHPSVVKKAKFYAKQEMNRPWLERQLLRPQSQAAKALSYVDPTGVLTGLNPLYRAYKQNLAEGESKGQAMLEAGAMHGLGALPVVGKGAWQAIAKNPATLAKLPRLTFKNSAADAFGGGPNSLAAGVINNLANMGQTQIDLIKAGAGAFSGGEDNSLSPIARERDVPWHLVRQERRAIREKRRGMPEKAYGGSMPEYQQGGDMDMGVTGEDLVFTGQKTPDMVSAPQPGPIGYDVKSVNQIMPRVPFGQPSAGPIVRSGVPVSSAPSAPAPAAPARVASKSVSTMSSGPRTTGGGYRYNAGFFGDRGRPSSGSITRRPQFKTKFHAEGGEMGESYNQEASDMGPGKGKWGRQFQKDQRRRARMGRFNSSYGCTTYNEEGGLVGESNSDFDSRPPRRRDSWSKQFSKNQAERRFGMGGPGCNTYSGSGRGSANKWWEK